MTQNPFDNFDSLLRKLCLLCGMQPRDDTETALPMLLGCNFGHSTAMRITPYMIRKTIDVNAASATDLVSWLWMPHILLSGPLYGTCVCGAVLEVCLQVGELDFTPRAGQLYSVFGQRQRRHETESQRIHFVISQFFLPRILCI